jgi:starch-binding outer membrane protein, SusD/RagB family
MKTIKKYIFIIAAIASMFFAGCSKDFLDIKPAGQKLQENTFFTDTTNIDAMLNGVYNTYLFKDGCDVFDYYRWWLGSVPSDEAENGGDNPTAWNEAFSCDNFSPKASDFLFKDLFGAMYNGISRATEVIEKLPEAKKVVSDKNKLNLINIRLGEAYFLRASFYFILTRAFGGVPVADHTLLSTEYRTISRGTIKDVYNLMENDLKTAIQYLPHQSEIDFKDIGRASKGAAKALLAKMYVYESSYFTYYGTNDVRMGAVQNRWQEAYDLCLDIINNEGYVLLGSIDDPKRLLYSTFWTDNKPGTNGFRFLFSFEGNNNAESIFAIQHIAQGGWAGNYGAGTALNQYIGARNLYFYDKNGLRQKGGENSHSWGFWVPTHQLDNLYDSLDIRRKVTIGRGPDSISGYPGDTVYGKVNIPGTSNAVTGWFTMVPTLYPATGLENMKYEIGPHADIIVSGGFQGNPQNMYYLRYADVVLLGAEAAMMINKSDSSLILFNRIRERARTCGDGIHPADLTGAVTKKEIMDEREREFALEGERFFDLVRWKEAYNVLNNSRLEWWDRGFAGGTNPNYNSLNYNEPKNDFFPLPSIEVEKNNNLKQYAGW